MNLPSHNRPTRILRKNLETGEITDVTDFAYNNRKPLPTPTRNKITNRRALLDSIWLMPFVPHSSALLRVKKIAEFLDEHGEGFVEVSRTTIHCLINTGSPFGQWASKNLFEATDDACELKVRVRYRVDPDGAALILEQRDLLEENGL